MSSNITQTYLNYEKNFDLPCDDILLFQVFFIFLPTKKNFFEIFFSILSQQRLNKLRRLDDKIIHILNAEIPTESFINEKTSPKQKCLKLVDEVSTFYSQRETSINKCILKLNEDISNLAQDSSNYRMQLREKQFNLRFFKEELSVDSIIRERSLKAIEERCKPFY